MRNKGIGKALNLTETPRTEDVIIKENINFNDLLLSETTVKGLKENGFEKTSPIQKTAIPYGKCGFDLIVQAKSGTGKTCVFTVIALEMLDVNLEKIQVLILTPTREIAVQVRDVIACIGKCFRGMKVEAFIGGLSLENDKKKLKKCQIAVGAPGRVKHLITAGLIKLDAVRLFVLDEADKLMEDNFRQDVSFIYLKLPDIKQMIAASATFPPELENFVLRYMTNPMRVSPGKETFLVGIRQFVSVVPSHLSVFVQMKNKLSEVCRILSNVSFKQCLIFSNYQSRAESICNELNKGGWPAIYISGSQNQMTRLKAMSSLKEFRCRVLLSTDLTSRGIDAENVNLIINLDLPYDGATYMHRIGRAGRYGSYGLAISIIQDGEELQKFSEMLGKIGCDYSNICLFPKEALEFDIWETKNEDFEKISSVYEEYSKPKAKSEQIIQERAKCEVPLKEETRKDPNKLLACSLTLPDKPEISDYDHLIKSCSQFQGQLENITSQKKTDFGFENYSQELKSLVISLEKDGWAEHRKKIARRRVESLDQYNKEKESQSQKEKDDDDEDDDDDDDDDNDDGSNECSHSENDFSESLDYDNSEDQFQNDCDNESPNGVYCDDTTDVSENSEEESDYEESVDSLGIKQWRSGLYSQLYAIRHYANYLKYFYYLNEMRDYR